MATAMKGVVNFAFVDCVIDEAICAAQQVPDVPHLLLLGPGKKQVYEGPMTKRDVRQFIHDFVPNRVAALRDRPAALLESLPKVCAAGCAVLVSKSQEPSLRLKTVALALEDVSNPKRLSLGERPDPTAKTAKAPAFRICHLALNAADTRRLTDVFDTLGLPEEDSDGRALDLEGDSSLPVLAVVRWVDGPEAKEWETVGGGDHAAEFAVAEVYGGDQTDRYATVRWLRAREREAQKQWATNQLRKRAAGASERRERQRRLKEERIAREKRESQRASRGGADSGSSSSGGSGRGGGGGGGGVLAALGVDTAQQCAGNGGWESRRTLGAADDGVRVCVVAFSLDDSAALARLGKKEDWVEANVALLRVHGVGLDLRGGSSAARAKRSALASGKAALRARLVAAGVTAVEVPLWRIASDEVKADGSASTLGSGGDMAALVMRRNVRTRKVEAVLVQHPTSSGAEAASPAARAQAAAAVVKELLGSPAGMTELSRRASREAISKSLVNLADALEAPQ